MPSKFDVTNDELRLCFHRLVLSGAVRASANSQNFARMKTLAAIKANHEETDRRKKEEDARNALQKRAAQNQAEEQRKRELVFTDPDLSNRQRIHKELAQQYNELEIQSNLLRAQLTAQQHAQQAHNIRAAQMHAHAEARAQAQNRGSSSREQSTDREAQYRSIIQKPDQYPGHGWHTPLFSREYFKNDANFESASSRKQKIDQDDRYFAPYQSSEQLSGLHPYPPRYELDSDGYEHLASAWRKHDRGKFLVNDRGKIVVNEEKWKMKEKGREREEPQSHRQPNSIDNRFNPADVSSKSTARPRTGQVEDRTWLASNEKPASGTQYTKPKAGAAAALPDTALETAGQPLSREHNLLETFREFSRKEKEKYREKSREPTREETFAELRKFSQAQ